MYYRLPPVAACLLGCLLTGHSATPSPGALHDMLSKQRVSSAYSPQQIARAYGVAPLYEHGFDGTGQTVALLEIDRFNPADLTAFDAHYDLSPATIHEYYVDASPDSLQNGGETTFDLEWIHALAPAAVLQVYYLDDAETEEASWQSMASALTMAANRGASVVSISVGGCGPGPGSNLTGAALSSLLDRDVSVFASSGDFGARPGPVKDCGKSLGVSYPGSDPMVVSVGGTSLHLDAGGSIAREVAWSSSGGGRETTFLRQHWERGPGVPRDSMRWVPDVAFLGDPNTGVNYLRGGVWYEAGGTSLGAPAWAAFWAILMQDVATSRKAVEPATRALYRIGNSPEYSTVFHDITAGSNGAYSAQPGWDAVTGWGTPDVGKLAATVKAWSPGS